MPEAPATQGAAQSVDRYLEKGTAVSPWKVSSSGTVDIGGGNSGALEATWSGDAPASLSISGDTIDLARQANGDMALVIEYQMKRAAATSIVLSMECGDDCKGSIDGAQVLKPTPGDTWTSAAVRLSCFARAGADMSRITRPLEITASAPLALSVRGVHVAPGEGEPVCPK